MKFIVKLKLIYNFSFFKKRVGIKQGKKSLKSQVSPFKID